MFKKIRTENFKKHTEFLPKTYGEFWGKGEARSNAELDFILVEDSKIIPLK